MLKNVEMFFVAR